MDLTPAEASKVLDDRLVAEYLTAGRQPPPSDQHLLTVVELLRAYWAFCRGYYVKDGKPTNEQDALRLVIRDTKRLYAFTPAADFGPRALKTVRQAWIDRGQSRSTINKNMRRLTRIFRWAAAEELLPATVHQALTTVPGLKKGRCAAPEPKPIAPVDLATVEQTIPRLPPVVADMVRLQMFTGMRPGEVCKLRPCDVERSRDVWEYAVGGHKTEHHGRQRVVYIGPEAQAVLRPYLLRAAHEPCFSPAEAVQRQHQARHATRTTPLSCGNRPGTNRQKHPKRQPRSSYGTSSYYRAIQRACDAAFPPEEPLEGDELKAWQSEHRWSPNQLRHTTGTAIRKRFGLEAAQVILGHAAADVTQVYAERDADKAREVARLIG